MEEHETAMDCPDCDGDGWTVEPDLSRGAVGGEYYPMQVQCPHCMGTGEIDCD